MALPKAEGGLRPIAVGETLRRVVGECLLTGVEADVRSRLEPLQVKSASVPEEAQRPQCTPPGSGPNATQQTLTGSSSNSVDPHRILVKLDLENAFRSTVLIAWRSWLQCEMSFLLWRLGLTSSTGWNPHCGLTAFTSHPRGGSFNKAILYVGTVLRTCATTRHRKCRRKSFPGVAGAA